MNGNVHAAIETARLRGNYDALLAIATRADTPEAQRLLREAIAREKAEHNDRLASWRQWCDDVMQQCWS